MLPFDDSFAGLFSRSSCDASAVPLVQTLPEWNLTDLYSAMDAPELEADLVKADAGCKAFEADYKGRLATVLDGGKGGAALAGAVKRYEEIEDLIGRIASYGSLVYAGDTSDPARAKFYGDIQERLTDASTHLLFFTLEMNLLDDAALEAAMAEPALGHYRPWIEDLRKDRPYQLEDRIEQLFHEKAGPSRSAWSRLFDETITSLRFHVNGQDLPIEPTLNMMQDPKEEVRRAAGQALAETFSKNLRLFSLITNTLAKDKEISDRWRKFPDVASSRHLANRVEQEVVDAMVASIRASYPRLSHRYYALKARWFGKDKLEFWDRNAPLPKVETREISWAEARDTVLGAYSTFSPRMAEIAQVFFDKSWIDAPVRPASLPARSPIPPCPQPILMCC